MYNWQFIQPKVLTAISLKIAAAENFLQAKMKSRSASDHSFNYSF
jgi:hypothetical protein